MTISPALLQMLVDEYEWYYCNAYYNSKRRTMSKQDKITHAIYFTLHAITIALLLAK